MSLLILKPIVIVGHLIMLNSIEVAKIFEVEGYHLLQHFIGTSRKHCSLVKTSTKDFQQNLKIDESRDGIALDHVVSATSVVVPRLCHFKGFQGC